jgi:hypothetical protein
MHTVYLVKDGYIQIITPVIGKLSAPKLYAKGREILIKLNKIMLDNAIDSWQISQEDANFQSFS